MLIKNNSGKTILFYKTQMEFLASLDDTDGQYTTIRMTHLPNKGPAMHMHPLGPETFLVLEGSYIFTLDGKEIHAELGDFVLIPTNVPHKYVSGPEGGRLLVTTPPRVELYFLHIADLLEKGEKYDVAYEYEIARENGQTFIEQSDDLGHK